MRALDPLVSTITSRTLPILVFVLLTTSAAAQPLTLSELGLPNAVEVSAESVLIEQDGPQPGPSVKLRQALTWMTSEYYLPQGDLGRSMYSYSHATKDESITYVVGSQQILRLQRFRDTGSMATEMFVTPLVVVRMSQLADQTGHPTTRQRQGSNIVATFDAPASIGGTYTAIIDADRRRLLRLEGWQNGQLAFEVEFERYRSVGDGHLPHEIRRTFHTDPPFSSVWTVSKAAVVEDVVPPIASFPKTAHIIDMIEGVTKTADGTVLGPIDLSPSSDGSGGGRWAMFLTFAGVVMVVAAAFIWRAKSRVRE